MNLKKLNLKKNFKSFFKKTFKISVYAMLNLIFVMLIISSVFFASTLNLADNIICNYNQTTETILISNKCQEDFKNVSITLALTQDDVEGVILLNHRIRHLGGYAEKEISIADSIQPGFNVKEINVEAFRLDILHLIGMSNSIVLSIVYYKLVLRYLRN